MLERILAGLRVVDLTQNVAGPFCTQVLGDLGAEVIKVERPARGDDTRDWLPPAAGEQSATFLALNRNKRSICIDLNSSEGVAVVKKLCQSADILIHSMKPGSAEARRLGFEDLSAVNPAIIYCAISAFGQTGPLRGLPGYDPLMQAFSGVMSVTGNEGDAPVRVGVSLIDMGTGMWAAIGTLAAVIERGRTGKGTLVEASLMETSVAWMSVFVASYLATSALPKKLGSAMAMAAPYELFEAADGHVFIAAGNDRLFASVCDGLGVPALAEDPRFRTNSLRVLNRDALKEEIAGLTRRMKVSQIVERLRRAGAPCGEMQDVSQMLANEQVVASEIIADLPIHDAPEHKVVALPLKMGGHRSRAMNEPPRLGGDTDQVLLGLGYSKPQLENLRSSGAIA